MNNREPMNAVTLARALDLIAKSEYDGHFTIFGFTGGSKVMFGTPNSRADIYNAVPGATIEDAAKNCIAQYVKSHPPNSQRYDRLRQQAEHDNVSIPMEKEISELAAEMNGEAIKPTRGENWTAMQLSQQSRKYEDYEEAKFYE